MNTLPEDGISVGGQYDVVVRSHVPDPPLVLNLNLGEAGLASGNQFGLVENNPFF